MSVGRVVSIFWRVDYLDASSWTQIPRQSGHRLMPQTGRSAVAVGGKSQYTCVSCLALLLQGTFMATSSVRIWRQS